MKNISKYINKKVNKIVYCRATKKGEFNYWLGIAVVAAIMLVVGFPVLKTIATNMWNSIESWFDTAMDGIFG